MADVPCGLKSSVDFDCLLLPTHLMKNKCALNTQHGQLVFNFVFIQSLVAQRFATEV